LVFSSFVGGSLSDYLNDVVFGEMVPEAAHSLLASMNVNEFLSALIVDGIVAGFGAVVGFLLPTLP
jgi:Fe2+ transport system protein B